MPHLIVDVAGRDHVVVDDIPELHCHEHGEQLDQEGQREEDGRHRDETSVLVV